MNETIRLLTTCPARIQGTDTIFPSIGLASEKAIAIRKNTGARLKVEVRYGGNWMLVCDAIALAAGGAA